MGNMMQCCKKETEESVTKTVSKEICVKPRTTEEVLQEFIKEKLLKDPSMNNSYLPDPLEKEIYFSILNSVMIHMKKITETIHIEFLDHTITIQIQPKPSHPIDISMQNEHSQTGI